MNMKYPYGTLCLLTVCLAFSHDAAGMPGGDWIQATAAAPWSARRMHATAVYNNKMWVMGGISSGTNKNDVWSTSDGKNWTEVTSSAAWSARRDARSLVFGGKLWLLGGAGAARVNDVWSTSDGSTWNQETAAAEWPARSDFCAFVHNNRMWILGGQLTGGAGARDVWYSTNGVNWTEATAAAPWSERAALTCVVFSGRMWVMGGYDTSVLGDVWSSADGATWRQETASAPWAARFRHTSVTHDGKMWVLGGALTGETPSNDVWHSTDGQSWTLSTASAQWDAREKLESVVFNNAIWVLGGYDGAEKNDVWHTTNYAGYWTQATAAAPWGPRKSAVTLVHQNKMWMVGGEQGTTRMNDVWSSPDGVNWTQVTANAAWPARQNHTALSFAGRMWVLGGWVGSTTDDIWSSSDGVTWNEETTSPGWPARYTHSSTVYDGKMWVMGGSLQNGTLLNDVWWSSDGTTWTQATAAAPWAARLNQGTIVLNGKMWMLGGWNGAVLHDAWYTTDGISWTRATDAAPWTEGFGVGYVAADNKMWSFGGGHDGVNNIGCNAVWSSEDGINWTLSTGSASWPGRFAHGAVSFRGALWALGGEDQFTGKSDVWFASKLGSEWTQATSAAEWTGRYDLQVVKHNARLWVIGGHEETTQTYKPEVWSSDDGASWTQVANSVSCLARSAPTCLSYGDNLWIIGGYNASSYQYLKDVWRSADGVSWTQVTGSAAWERRHNHASVVFDNKMWVTGGYYYDGTGHCLNDVWWSADGSTWTQATAAAEWSGRFTHSALVYDNKMWIIGGLSTDGTTPSYKDDVWYSSDGTTWTCATDTAPWGVRGEHASAVWAGRMWVLGGTAGAPTEFRDVWSSLDGVTWSRSTTAADWPGRHIFGAAAYRGALWVMGGHDGTTGPNFRDVWYSPSVIFVDKDATGTEDGETWGTAFRTIQEGVDAATARGGAQVWVAEGTYDETRPHASGALELKPGAWLYGGFSGTETSLSLRDLSLHTTTIDGSVARAGSTAYHVVIGADDSGLDGFTVTGGSATGGGEGSRGGGMYNFSVSPLVSNCVFTGNTGEMTSVEGGEVGGGMANYYASPFVVNCVFAYNSSYDGAGMINLGSSAHPRVVNCTFTHNNGTHGAAIHNHGGAVPVLINCVLWGNVPDEISLASDGSSIDISYSDIQGGYSGTGNINSDPLFVDVDDFRLGSGSPCLNTGTAVGAPSKDIIGQTRPQGTGIDMGAYEAGPPVAAFTATPVAGLTPLTVSFTDQSVSTTGPITAWVWNFGDGGLSMSQNPTHTYTAAGMYDVSLTIFNNVGWDSTTKQNYVSVGLTLVISAHPVSRTVNEGSPVTFTVAALGTPPLSYQWAKDTVTIPGATGASYTIAATQESHEGDYTCEVSSPSESLTSNAATLSVNVAPTQPGIGITPAAPNAGNSLLCEVSSPSTDSDGDTVRYRFEWFFSTNGTDFTGPQRNVLTAGLSDVLEGSNTLSGGYWRCIVTPNDGVADGPSAQTTVSLRLAITQEPVSTVLAVGGAGSLSVVAAGTPPISYQWFKAGLPISGATQSSYAITNAVEQDEGVYTCEVSNPTDTLESAPATITVEFPPTPATIQITPSGPIVGTPLTCTVTQISTDPDGQTVQYRYEWYSSTNDIVYNGPVLSTLTEATVNVLDGGYTGSGGFWKCVVTPTDGALNGPAAQATAHVMASSSITCSVAPLSVTLGQTMTLSGSISGMTGGGTVVSFTSTSPSGVVSGEFPASVAIGGSAYSKLFLPTEASEGRTPWSVRAAWPGDLNHAGATSSAISFTVNKAQPHLSLALSHSSALINLGNLPSFTVTATLFVPGFPADPALQAVLANRAIRLSLMNPEGETPYQPLTAVTDINGVATFSKSDFLSQQGVFSEPGTWRFLAEFAGDNNLRLTATDDFDFTAARLSIKRGAGYAILALGRYEWFAEGHREHAQTAEYIYRVLRERGFEEDDIYYLREYLYDEPDYGQPVYPPRKENLVGPTGAIQSWARAKMLESPAPLYVIMVDHGNLGVFHMYSGFGRDNVVRADEIAQSLGLLQSSLSGDPVASRQDILVINGSCYSGSFIPVLAGPRRTIITSCMANEQSYRGVDSNPNDGRYLRDGDFFLMEFFRNALSGRTVKDCFELSCSKTYEYTATRTNYGISRISGRVIPQHPLLDDNGDGKGTSGVLSSIRGMDGARVADLDLGLAANAGNGVRWFTVQPPITLALNGTITSLNAETTGGELLPGDSAWIEIKTPEYDDGETATPGYEQFQKVVRMIGPIMPSAAPQPLGGGKYRFAWTQEDLAANSEFDGFKTSGVYKVYYFLRDNAGNHVSAYLVTNIYVGKPGNQAPEKVSLIYPKQGAITSPGLFFAWDDSTDPDGDPITYRLEVSEDPAFPEGNTIMRDGLTDVVIRLDAEDGILNETDYHWRVTPVDSYGATPSQNDVRQFSTRGNAGGPGFITGRVFVEGTDLVIPGAHIEVVPEPSDDYEPVMSTEMGRYHFDDVEEGAYTLNATAAGYAPRSVKNVVVISEEITRIDIELRADGLTNHAPVMEPMDNVLIRAGSMLTLRVFATDPDPTDTLTFSAANLPPGAQFVSYTGVMTWQPTQADVGVYSNVLFIATDSGSPSMSATHAITITVLEGARILGPSVVQEGARVDLRFYADGMEDTWLIQWSKDGVLLPAVTGPTYSIPSATFLDQGWYEAVAIDGSKSLSEPVVARFYLQVTGAMPVAGPPALLALLAGMTLFAYHALGKRR